MTTITANKDFIYLRRGPLIQVLDDDKLVESREFESINKAKETMRRVRDELQGVGQLKVMPYKHEKMEFGIPGMQPARYRRPSVRPTSDTRVVRATKLKVKPKSKKEQLTQQLKGAANVMFKSKKKV